MNKKINKSRKRVFVGLSGGVDSSVTASLLVRAGYDVTGVFIKSWHPDWFPCTWKEDRRDAMRVSAHLGIKFRTLDLEKEYKQMVIDYLLEEYKNGRTPNPDVMCNKHIKFGLFLKYAMSEGTDYVATGHYARIENTKESKYKLLRGTDPEKDQSYFLWTLGQNELSHTLFPVGDYLKKNIRSLAKKFGLPTFAKPDSQGLCFVGNISMKEFLSHYLTLVPGNVLDESGKVIGKHDGVYLYTFGQRHGFVITEKSTNNERMYVVGRDIEKNTITVASKSENFHSTGVILESVNWIQKPVAGEKYSLQSRYRQKTFLGKIDPEKNSVTFEKPQEYVSVGQSLVVYNNDNCLGGGVIKEVVTGE